MQLISKELRDQIGIDTLERAIIFSLQQIKQGNELLEENKKTSLTNLDYFVENKQDTNGLKSTLTIKAKIPYDRSEFNKRSGDYLQSIQEISTNPVDYKGENLSVTVDNTAIIPPEPEFVDTVEKYFVWASSSWVFQNKNTDTDWLKNGKFSFLDNATTPVYSCELILPIDFDMYGVTQNLLQAVTQKIKNLDYNLLRVKSDFEAISNDKNIVGNEAIFGNEFIVGN